MAQRTKKTRQGRQSARRPLEPLRAGAETRTGEAATVAWTVSVTTVLLCNVAAAVASWYAGSNPQASAAAMFGAMMLLAAAGIGLASLALLPVLYRLRRVPPPTGIVVFGACAAAAPVVAVIVRALR